MLAEAVTASATENQAMLQAGVSAAVAQANAPVTLSADGSVTRPSVRPTDLVLASATVTPKPTPEPTQEIVTRLSTSGGQHWGINVGRYTTRYEAEKVLLRTALAEMSTLDGSLRKVGQSTRGFDATFVGMTRETADLACRRLQARNVTCFMIGPS